MSLSAATNSLFQGNLSDAFNFLWVSDADIATAAKQSEDLAAFNDRKFKAGMITEQQKIDLNKRITLDGSYTERFKIPDLNPWNGFEQGLGEGATNIQNAVKSTVNTTAGFTIGLLPWWVWALVILGGVFYLLPIIAAILPKKA